MQFARILHKSWFKQCILNVKLTMGEHAATPYSKYGSPKIDHPHHPNTCLHFLCIVMEDNKFIQCLLFYFFSTTFISLFQTFSWSFRKITLKTLCMYSPLNICDRYRVIITKWNNFTNYSYLFRCGAIYRNKNRASGLTNTLASGITNYHLGKTWLDGFLIL